MRIKTNGIAKWITGAALAAALLLVTPNKAQAQVAFQVGIGGGGYGYGAPVYNAYGAYGAVPYDNWHRDHWADRRDYDWQAQRAAEWRHDQWQRFHNDHRDNWGDRGCGYDHGGRGW